MSAQPGKAYLVGAGPGDPGLMTARAIDLIATADAILYDRLIPDRALDGAREDAELIYVGKLPERHSLPQDEIEALMVELTRQGKSVVRLKGGDPFTFGRGGEEAETLVEAGVPFEVVPGVTAGIAASAYAGIPVTHRDESSAVAFVTGHEDPRKDSPAETRHIPTTPLDYEGLASFPGTLVFYMGVGRLPEIAERLIAAGRDPSEPCAVIQRGTFPDQRMVAAPLAGIAQAVHDAGIKPPAVTVIGSVTDLHQRLAWVESRPLHGSTVVVTRARAQASGLAGQLTELGAEVVELPAIRIEPRIEAEEVRRAVESIHSYALICLTSPNGVRLLFEAMALQGRDARALNQAVVAAIGPGTAAALAEHGVIADIVPERFVAEELVGALEEVDVADRPVLLARASEARDVLPDALAERGAKLDVVALYETVVETPSDEALERAVHADYLTFTSSSTVRNLLGVLGGELPGSPRVVSIGPVTSETAREAGLKVDVEAERHDIDGLIAALVDDAAAQRGN